MTVTPGVRASAEPMPSADCGCPRTPAPRCSPDRAVTLALAAQATPETAFCRISPTTRCAGRKSSAASPAPPASAMQESRGESILSGSDRSHPASSLTTAHGGWQPITGRSGSPRFARSCARRMRNPIPGPRWRPARKSRCRSPTRRNAPAPGKCRNPFPARTRRPTPPAGRADPAGRPVPTLSLGGSVRQWRSPP